MLHFLKRCIPTAAAAAVAAALTATLAPVPAAAQETAAQQTPTRGGTLTVGFRDDAKTLDPIYSVQWSERQVLFLVFNTLVRLGPDFGLQPELAKSWDFEEDGKRIVLHLQEGVKFHDGTDFDAAAVKWNLDQRLSKEAASPQRSQLEPVIDTVEVIDPHTVALNLKKPFPPLLSLLADRAGFMVSPAAVQKYGKDFGSNPVGTGPFVFREWVRGSTVRVERNPSYWEAGLPYLDGVVFSDISAAVVGVQRLMTGELDFVAQLSPQDIRLLEGNPEIRLAPVTVGQWQSLQWHWDEPPFNNPKLRQAIAHAIDRGRLNQILWSGRGTASNGPTPPGLWWSPPETAGYAYDPELSRKLIAESGIGPDTELVLSAPSDNVLRQMSQLIAENLQAVGLKVRLEPIAQSDWYARVVDRKINFTPMRWTQRADPDGLIFILFHSQGAANSTGYNNPEVDRLIDEARAISDPAKRKALYDQVHALISADLPYVPLAFAAEYAAMSVKVGGFEWIPDLIPRFAAMWKTP